LELGTARASHSWHFIRAFSLKGLYLQWQLVRFLGMLDGEGQGLYLHWQLMGFLIIIDGNGLGCFQGLLRDFLERVFRGDNGVGVIVDLGFVNYGGIVSIHSCDLNVTYEATVPIREY